MTANGTVRFSKRHLLGIEGLNIEAMLPTDWNTAIRAFSNSEVLKEILGPVFHRAFSTCKAQECEELGRKVTDIEYQTYLGSI